MKPHFQFYFADEPHRAVYESREYVAHLLRAYRKRPQQYRLRRAGLHSYLVTIGGVMAVIAI